MTHFMKAKIKKTVSFGLIFMASKWTIIYLLYHSGYWTYWFLLLFPIADTCAAIAAIWYLKGNFKKYFAQVLEELYPDDFKEILSKTDAYYATLSDEVAFAKQSKNPLDKRIDFSSYFLSLIAVLEKRGESFQVIREVSISVAKEYIKPKNKLHRWYLKMVPKMANKRIGQYAIRKMQEKVSIKQGAAGFKAQIITNKKETFGLGYGIDIKSCGICTLFKKHDRSEYMPILCEIDQLTSQIAGLQLVRTATLAAGDGCCDFRFKQMA